MRKNPPLYQTVRDRLLRRITSGELGVGDQLEPEVELADTYGVSRATMRSAIRELVGKGLLVRRPGVGTQVVRSTPVVEPSRLDELLESFANDTPGARVLILDAGVTTAPEEVATAMQLDAGSKLLRVHSICKAGDEVLASGQTWVSPSVGVSASEARTAPLYSLVEQTYGHAISHGRDSISAQQSRGETGRLLGVRAGTLLVVVERIAYDGSGAPVLFSQVQFRSGSYRYQVTLPRAIVSA